MTAQEIRDIGYLRWRDPWAWMEPMKGKRWETMLQREKSRHHKLIQQPSVSANAQRMKQEITDAHQYLFLKGLQAGSGQIDIVLSPEIQFYWKRSWHKRYKKAYDLDVDSNHVWYITNTADPYIQQLLCEDHTGHQKWVKSNCTPQVAVIGDLCYYIYSKGAPSSTTLFCCDAVTGKKEFAIYEEKNVERSLSFVKGCDRTLYLISEDPMRTDTYLISGRQAHPFYKGTLFQMPLGGNTALVRNVLHEPWVAMGAPINEWKLPSGTIEWTNALTGHMITLDEGSETLWHCAPNKAPRPLFRLKAGAFFYHEWNAWENTPYSNFMIQSPFTPPFLLHVVHTTVHRIPSTWPIARPVRFPTLDVHKWHAPSTDGTQVPYFVIHQKGVTPKAQIVYVYGAYGSTSVIQWPYAYWYPLLTRGWAITYALVRGGGDDTEEWANAARREHRHVSIEDYEAVIRGSQRRLRLSPKKTVLYGRSAGGVPVGAVVARWPKGEMAGAVFTEVPYVDVLRTSTNPTLPLTIGEYKEFGNPLERLVNFRELLHVSPVNSLPSDGAPDIFVMARVGLQDQQVYAYESFKWIQRLRGHMTPEDEKKNEDNDSPKKKYVTFERKEEHVYRAANFPRFRGIDLAVLEAWAEDRLRF